MAKIVTPRGPVALGAARSVRLESRVISLWCMVKQGVHFPTWFGYTQPIANYFRLLGVRCWFDPLRTADGDQVNYAFFVGTERPASPAAIFEWDAILPVYHEQGITKIWTQTQHSDPQEWSMNKVYEGRALRLGVWLETSGTVGIVQMFTSFEISEG